MKLDDDLPTSISWMTRTIGYGLGLAIILGLLVVTGKGKLATNTLKCLEEPGILDKQSALENAQAIGACLERRNGFFENMLMSSIHKTLRSLPNAPCRYVGVWNSSRSQATYQVALLENGEFTVEPVSGRTSADVSGGSWGVHENRMVWIYSQGNAWPPDGNIITSTGPDSFSLAESDGTHTSFSRVGAITSSRCSQ